MTDTLTGPETARALIPIFDAAELRIRATNALAEARSRFAVIESVPLDDANATNVLDKWDQTAMILEDAFGPISLLNSVHPDQSVRDAADGALLDESGFITELFQNEALFERVRRVKPHSIAEKQLQKDLIEAFEDSGVALPPDRRARFKEISDRLTGLAQEFAKNIRESTTRLHFTPEECGGLPQSWLDRVPRDENGNIVVGFDYPDYIPFMTNSRNEAARKRYYVAYTNRGTPKNVEILDEIVALRKEIAELYGVPAYAHYVTKRRMVENPETVLSFLDEVRSVVLEAEIRDLGDLGVMKSEITGIPAEKADIERWDM
ncbi:MAG: M3 family metallopeptidase, partial [Thermoanaerobaculia bacterium]